MLRRALHHSRAAQRCFVVIAPDQHLGCFLQTRGAGGAGDFVPWRLVNVKDLGSFHGCGGPANGLASTCKHQVHEFEPTEHDVDGEEIQDQAS